jgi:hypothetical protein
MTVDDMIKLLQQLPFHDAPIGMYDMQGNVKKVEVQIHGGAVILCPIPGLYLLKKRAANAS